MAEITTDFMVGTKDKKEPSSRRDLDHGHAWLSYL